MRLFPPEDIPVPDDPAWSYPLPPQPRRWPAMAISLALHLLLAACAPAIEEYLFLLQGDSRNVRLYAAQMVPLRLPEKLYLYAEPPPRPPAPPRAQPAREPAPSPRSGAGITLSPGVELPRLPAPPQVKSTIIQPVPPSAEALLAPVPTITAWTAPDRVAPKSFVLPGSVKKPVAQPLLDAPPVLATPNREQRLSDLNITGLPSATPPALPRPPSRTTPVRVFQPPAASGRPAGGEIAWQAGDPANLITLGAAGLPSSIVSVPAVVARAGSGGAGPAPPGPSGAGAGGTGDSGGGAASGSGGSPKSSGSSSGSGSSPTGSATGIARQVVELTPGVDRQNPSPRVTRVARPKDGSYGFLVMGSAPEEAFPESAGMLSGRLVYTVYLRIGARRDWILQYCLPRSAPEGDTGRGSAARLDAPYAVVMLRPEVSFVSDDDYLFVRGLINDAGTFEKLEQLGDAVVANKESMLSTLRKWEFRPASRDGKPVPVETLLIIPRQEP